MNIRERLIEEMKREADIDFSEMKALDEMEKYCRSLIDDQHYMSEDAIFDTLFDYKGLILEYVAEHDESKADNPYKGRPTIMYGNAECYIDILAYQSDKLVMGLQLIERKSRDPYATVSVNLGECYRPQTFVPCHATFIDTNNNPISKLQDLFEKTGAEPHTVFGEPYYKASGFCTYPLYDFNAEKLKEFDPKGFEDYEKGYYNEIPAAQRRLSKELGWDDFEEDMEMEEDERY